MLSNSLADRTLSRQLFDGAAAMSRPLSLPSQDVRHVIARSNGQRAGGTPNRLVRITPQHAVARRGEAWRGIAAEIVQATSHEPVEYRFKAPVHLLIVYEQGVRHEGETFIESLPRSTLRDVTRKLTFVPAGHEYRESQHPRVPARSLYFYVDPTALPFASEPAWSDVPMAPRLFFEDASLWGTAIKLMRVLQETDSSDRLYVEALGCVLAHELAQFGRSGARNKKTVVRGGLSSWQPPVWTPHT